MHSHYLAHVMSKNYAILQVLWWNSSNLSGELWGVRNHELDTVSLHKLLGQNMGECKSSCIFWIKICGYLWMLWSLWFILATAKQPLKFHYVCVHFEAILVGPGCRKKNSNKKVFSGKHWEGCPRTFWIDIFGEKHVSWQWDVIINAAGCFFLARFYGKHYINCTGLEFANADRPLRTMILLELCL